MSTNQELIYVWDAYCGWCYGFSNGLQEFHENHPELPLKVLSGGLFIGDRSLPISSYPHIPAANQRISQMTGVQFGPAYEALLAEGGFVLDSEAAAVGFAALRSLAPERAVYLASSMQKEFYYEGKSLNDIQTYVDIAKAHDLDASALEELIADPKMAEQAYSDFKEVRRLSVNSFPTLLLKTDESYVNLGSGSMKAADLEAAYKKLTASN